MPNTLAHIGAQGWMGRAVFKKADLPWILLGLTVPDLPWMLQRLIRGLFPGIDPYDLRAYVIVQASFFGCLLLCGAVSFIAQNTKRVFFVVSVNAFLHLLLDAAQTKWADGVHLSAPFSWEPVSFGWFWPEDWPSHAMTAAGAAFMAFSCRSLPKTSPGFRWKPVQRPLAALLFLGAYFTAPVLLQDGPYHADNHFIRTLAEKADRAGKTVEFDRNKLQSTSEGMVLKTFFGEEIRLTGNFPNAPGILSLKGRFTGAQTLEVQQFHVHTPFRDWFSYAGLAWLLFFWAVPFFRAFRSHTP